MIKTSLKSGAPVWVVAMSPRKNPQTLYGPGGGNSPRATSFIEGMTPHFCKTRKELAYLLLSRGMASSSGLSIDELQREMYRQLSRVNYYRLSAYWYQFLAPDEADSMKRSKNFRPGTCWERVMEYYRFDHQLRLLLFDAISRIEIGLREQIASALATRMPDSVNPQTASTITAPSITRPNMARTANHTSPP